MKKVGLLTLLVSGIGISLIGSGVFNQSTAPSRDTLAIVELKDELGEDEESRKVVLQKFQNELFNSVGFNYRIENSLTNIGNFVFVKVNSESIDSMKNFSSVKSVQRNHFYAPQSVEGVEGKTEPLPDTTQAFTNYSRLDLNAQGSKNQGKGTLIAVLDNYFQLNHECFKDLPVGSVKYTEEEMNTIIGNSTLNAKGTTYYNNKIPFYYDYADKDNTMTPPGATSDNTHGIHVASMAAANGTFTGIAPDAQVALMKISPDSNTGSASDVTILSALEDSVKIGADVINLSFGSPIIEDPAIREEEESGNGAVFSAIKTLTEQGVIMSISAGNEGKGAFIKDNIQTNDYGDYVNNSFDWVDNGIIGSFADTKYGTVVASSRLSAQYDGDVQKSSLYTQKVSGFSSEGPTYDLGLNPDIITPGQNTYGGVYYDIKDSSAKKYEKMSGTSMAAPNYTGVVASVLSDYIYKDNSDRETYQKTLTQRLQSTAKPLVQSNGAYYSPRKQGAGQPDIGEAVSSEVYLEGVNKKAKIELKNNSDIAAGHVKFTVTTHNESSSTKKYKARLGVQCPGTAKDDTQASLFDVEIGNYIQDVEIPSGDGSFEVDYTIDASAKETLAMFPNGTFLEGYVVLTPYEDTLSTLSIPYMGFYGDYSQAECVEKFDFEKKEGEITGSDIINSAYQTKGSKANADFASTMVTSKESLQINYSNVVSGMTNLKRLGTPVLREDNKIIVGISNLSNYLSINQIVYRNIVDNKVELINSDNKVVKSNKLSNQNESKDYQTSDGHLYKSLILSEQNGLTCSKAMTEFNFVNSDGTLVYPIGEYKLKFTYNLAYGSTIVKEYPLVIRGGVATSPLVGKKVISGEEGSEVVRVNIEENIISATLNGDKYEILSDENGKYISFKKADFASRGKVLLVLTNELNLVTQQLFNIKDLENGFSVESSFLKTTYNASLTTEVGEVGEDKKFTVKYLTEIKDARGNVANDVAYYIVNVNLPEKANIVETEEVKLNDLIKVEETGYDGSVKALTYTIHDGIISYETNSGNVTITYVEAETPAVAMDLTLIIVVSVVAVVVIAGLVVTFVIISKKKKAKKNVQ